MAAVEPSREAERDDAELRPARAVRLLLDKRDVAKREERAWGVLQRLDEASPPGASRSNGCDQ